jgi:hypothetical protein
MHRVGDQCDWRTGAAKQIDNREYFAGVAHKVIQNSKMRSVKVSTLQQLANVLTKAVPYQLSDSSFQGIMNVST